MPPPVRYSLPDWLWDAFVASHAHEAQALALAMLEPAPIDLRVNPLRTRPGALVATLEAKGIPVEPIAGLANGLRVRGRPALESLDAWAHGGFEMQDAASQRLVALCAPRQGQVVVDFCAGAGGKALAMASRMRNIGQVYAFDPVEARLAALRERAARAGATIVLPVRIADENDARLARYAGRADLVLVDAPCSGTGTLRRHPDLKWRLAPADVAGYVALQRRILRAAAKLVRTGGMLVYATCSVLAEENVAQLDSFGIENDPKYRERPLIELDRDIIDGQWLPGRDDSDGFFVGRWLREADGHYNRMVTHRVTKGVTP
ncbi:MAG: RsmB/NOP family class I SAM-dependent RNA methyltransferase [Lautropia sp.]